MLYNNLVVLIPPQNMFKMFPQISGLENITFFKRRYGNLAITIKAGLFNIYQWLCIIIHHTNYLINFWQIPSEWCKILDSLNHQTSLQLNWKSLGQPFIKWLTIYQISVNESPMLCSLYCQDTLISIVRTHSFIWSGHINLYCQNTYRMKSRTILIQPIMMDCNCTRSFCNLIIIFYWTRVQKGIKKYYSVSIYIVLGAVREIFILERELAMLNVSDAPRKNGLGVGA